MSREAPGYHSEDPSLFVDEPSCLPDVLPDVGRRSFSSSSLESFGERRSQHVSLHEGTETQSLRSCVTALPKSARAWRFPTSIGRDHERVPKLRYELLNAFVDQTAKGPTIIESQVLTKGPDSSASEDTVVEQNMLDPVVDSTEKLRFEYFRLDLATPIRSTTIGNLSAGKTKFSEIFGADNGVWWLDCRNPEKGEVRAFAKVFGLHSLTVEDIVTMEERQKFETFENYSFVCFHAFDENSESETYLKPVRFYMLLFPFGVITLHFGNFDLCTSVQQRLMNLAKVYELSSEWVAYAILEHISNSFVPVVKAIGAELDVLAITVFNPPQFKLMRPTMRGLYEARKNSVAIQSLLSNKSEVIKAIIVLIQEKPISGAKTDTSAQSVPHVTDFKSDMGPVLPHGGTPSDFELVAYLGDVMDCLSTLQARANLLEMSLARCHLSFVRSLEMGAIQTSKLLLYIFSKMATVGPILMPLIILTSLFSMNVRMPGEYRDKTGEINNLRWWFGIFGFVCLVSVGSLVFVNVYFNAMDKDIDFHLTNGRSSLMRRQLRALRNILLCVPLRRHIHRRRDLERGTALRELQV